MVVPIVLPLPAITPVASGRLSKKVPHSASKNEAQHTFPLSTYDACIPGAYVGERGSLVNVRADAGGGDGVPKDIDVDDTE